MPDYVLYWEPSSIGGIWHRMRWVGMWHGGHSYSSPYAEDAEYFPSLRQAVNAVDFRRRNGWMRCTFRKVVGGTSFDACPNAHDDNSGGMHLYRVNGGMSPEDIQTMIETGYPDRVIEFGPRGGIRIERA